MGTVGLPTYKGYQNQSTVGYRLPVGLLKYILLYNHSRPNLHPLDFFSDN